MRIIVLISTLFAFSLASMAQSKSEVQEMMIPVIPKSSYHSEEFENVSMLRSLLYFYKNFISSQDASNCSFSPSCSVYAAQAVKRQGIIKGLINFADRFQRCHGKDPEQYIYLEEEHLLYDPVRDGKYRLVE